MRRAACSSSSLLAACLLLLAPSLVAGNTSVEVKDGFGTIIVPEGGDGIAEVEKFAQLTRQAVGHVFEAEYLEQLAAALCADPLVACSKKTLGPPLSLALGNKGTITVAPGQAPAEAIDEFMVAARAQGKNDLKMDGVQQVLDYFCGLKPCVTPLQPTRVEVQEVGACVVEVGQEVADAVEAWAYAAWRAGHTINADGVGRVASELCRFKRCNRPVQLPPATVEVEGIGVVSVAFGEEPADAMEAFAKQANAAGHGLLPQGAVDQIMDRFCGATEAGRASLVPCHRDYPLKPVNLPIDLGGEREVPDEVDEATGEVKSTKVEKNPLEMLTVSVGQEPADAARSFLDDVMRRGRATFNADSATAIMQALCARKKCGTPLDLGPRRLPIQDVGTVVLPLGVEPRDAVSAFLETSREKGHRIGALDAQAILQAACGRVGPNGCRAGMDFNPVTLNITDVGTLVVPFGAEPAESAINFFEQARSAGHAIDADGAGQVMKTLCGLKRCNVPLDVRPVEVNVTGVGVVSVPFGAEPALSVAQFLLEARSKGHAIDADGATQIMEAVCANRPATLRCLVPLTVAPFSLNITDIGTFVVPFGAEPAAQLADFVNAVAAADPYGPAGRGEVVDASVAEQIMNLTCQSVACFVPIDLSPLSLNVTGYGRLVVPFGTEPAVGVDNFLRRCVAAGHVVDENVARILMESVCSQAWPVKCHIPLDVTPFSLSIEGVGTLTVPYGASAARSVATFATEALDMGHAVDADGVRLMLGRACESAAAAKPCAKSDLDDAGFLAPTTLNVTGVGNLTVPFGTDPADAVRDFIADQVYEGVLLQVSDAQIMMDNICARATCRKQLDLNPTLLPIEGYGALSKSYDVTPQAAVRAFGNANRLSQHAMQQVLNALCGVVKCKPEKQPKKDD